MGVMQYVVSDEFIVWLQSLSGTLTKMKTEYGGIVAMVEHRQWEGNHTLHAARLLRVLRDHLCVIDEELADHVKEQYG